MRNLGVFSTRQGEGYSRGMQVIARTQRGLETGEVLCEATDSVLAQMVEPKNGQILREQTDEDARELRRLFEQEQREHESCQARIAELELAMQLVDVERIYGGERVVVYYLAEERVDFRQLVKNLAKDFQTRIEMKQIGVRDEAKLLADYGDCGKPVCCNTHLSEMPPVSMRMAKLQKATLDPSKISGRCGRLKCCLRYEYDVYQELQKDLPPVGSEIITNKGKARVLAQEILAGQLLVETEDMRRIAIDAADVLTVLKRGNARGKPRRDDDDVDDEPAERGPSERGPADRGPRERKFADRGGPPRGERPPAAGRPDADRPAEPPVDELPADGPTAAGSTADEAAEISDPEADLPRGEE
jgi:cell fate regulator YaaT (PSP1 superfamily)